MAKRIDDEVKIALQKQAEMRTAKTIDQFIANNPSARGYFQNRVDAAVAELFSEDAELTDQRGVRAIKKIIQKDKSAKEYLENQISEGVNRVKNMELKDKAAIKQRDTSISRLSGQYNNAISMLAEKDAEIARLSAKSGMTDDEAIRLLSANGSVCIVSGSVSVDMDTDWIKIAEAYKKLSLEVSASCTWYCDLRLLSCQICD